MGRPLHVLMEHTAEGYMSSTALGMRELRSEEELQAALRAGRRAVVLFSAKWCPICRATLPRMKRLAKSRPDVAWMIVHHSKDVDAVFAKHGVQNLPTLSLFDVNGIERGSLVTGPHTFEKQAKEEIGRLDDFQP